MFSRFFWVVHTQKVSRISYQTAPPWGGGGAAQADKAEPGIVVEQVLLAGEH